MVRDVFDGIAPFCYGPLRMTSLGLLVFALVFLMLPWLMAPRAERVKPEIRGLTLVLWWINRVYCGLWHRLDISETHALPETGAVVLVSNHTCGIDHMLLQSATRRALGFMIAQEYYDWWVSRPFCKLTGCIPTRRDGRDLSATRAALRALKEGRVVPIFPEGRIIPESGRVFGEAKPGAAFIALKAGVPVIPAYIRGTPPTDEIFVAMRTPSQARVRFGAPIDLSDLVGEDRDDERASIERAKGRIMDAIRALRDGSEEQINHVQSEEMVDGQSVVTSSSAHESAV